MLAAVTFKASGLKQRGGKRLASEFIAAFEVHTNSYCWWKVSWINPLTGMVIPML